MMQEQPAPAGAQPPTPTPPTPVPAPPVATPPVVPKAAVEVMPQTSAKSSRTLMSLGTLFGGIAGVVLLLALAGGVYAYIEKLGPFAQAPYTNDNLLSGLLQSFGRIQSSSYTLSGSAVVVPRDADAEPFVVTTANAAQLQEQYQHDYVRVHDITAILAALTYGTKPYPRTIARIASVRSGYYASTFSTTDPATKQPYGYEVTEDGKDYALIVTFETDEALNQISQAYQFSSSTMRRTGKTVVFTKQSPNFFFISSTPPKPFLLQLSDAMRMVPSEMNAKLSVGAQSDWSTKDADWKATADATADFGDLRFKIDIDGLKKGSVYYVRLNNIPSFFGNALSAYKGTWISVDPMASSTQKELGYSYGSYVKSLSSNESSYKKEREEATQFMLAVVAIADKTHLFTFKKPPYAETLGGVRTYRYDLSYNKEALLAFYQQMSAEAKKYPSIAHMELFDDPGMLEYLKSDEFSHMFDYVAKNTTLSLWVDTDGYLAKVSYGMRLVPPDTAVALKDKQVSASIDLELADINKPVRIDVPPGARSLEEILAEVYKNYSGGRGL